MKRFILNVIIILSAFSTYSQTLGGYQIYDYLVTAHNNHGCNPAFVTGPPDDSLWVNFNINDSMTGTFGLHWVDRPGKDMMIETGFNTSNYTVSLLLSTGHYSSTHSVVIGDWTQLNDTLWHYLFTTCGYGTSTGHHYYLTLDFQTQFGLTTADTVVGIKIIFLNSSGAPDIAGVYIIQQPASCDTVHLGPDTTLCAGETLLLNATKTNSTYLWQDNSTNPTYTVTQAGTYWVRVTEPGCITSDTIIVSYTPTPIVTNSPPSETICSGESTNISLTSNDPGPSFHWTASLTSGNITGFIADSGLVINQILGNLQLTPGIVTYHITPKAGQCIGTPMDFAVTVDPELPISITINGSANNICPGTPVIFSATPTNSGAAPNYQWKVNGINSGVNSISFSYSPLNGDIVTCVLTSSIIACTSNNPATSNSITMTVNPNLPVSIVVTANQDTVCAGSSVNFTGVPVNGTPTSTFQWKVNGVNAGTNGQFYTYVPLNADVVYCIFTSDTTCTTGNPATSNAVSMIVNPNLPVGITISASSNPFCPGSPVTFSASPINGGLGPIYQWKVNGANAGTNSITLTYDPVNNDSVSCVMHSNLNCVTGNPATSGKIIMSGTLAPIVTFTSCFDTITTVNAKPIILKGGIPLGGTYSGPGVNSSTGIFTPSIAGTGTKTIVYSYTNAVLCTASKSIHIIVHPVLLFTCGNNLTDIRDNKVYPTVQIGSQCWMASNLNYGTELTSTQDQRDNCVSEKYCFNDNPGNCTNQGGLYQWNEVMQYDNTPADQGFCPPAWHIPTENDWNTLFANYINNGFAGGPLKYSGFSGFNALLSGTRHINSSWDFQGFATFIWSSTDNGPTKAWAHGMNIEDPSVSIYPASRVNAFSIRCIKD